MSAAGEPHGFTLIEMLVAMAIMALIAAIGFPAIERMLARQTFETTARGLEVALRAGRADAVRRDLPVPVAITPDRRGYRVGSRPPVALPEGAALTLPAGGITFFGDGSATGGEAALAIGAARRVLVVDAATGAVAGAR